MKTATLVFDDSGPIGKVSAGCQIRAPAASDGVKGQRTMKRHAESHLDHALTDAQVAYIFERFAGRDAFFIETIELPVELGTAPCFLYGPIMGDLPVPESEVHYVTRGNRAYKTRSVHRDARPTRKVTVIAGPHESELCILYTAFGGPLAPQEPGDVRAQLKAIEELRRNRAIDPANGCDDTEERARLDPLVYGKIVQLRAKRAESDAFWGEHALGCAPDSKLG